MTKRDKRFAPNGDSDDINTLSSWSQRRNNIAQQYYMDKKSTITQNTPQVDVPEARHLAGTFFDTLEEIYNERGLSEVVHKRTESPTAKSRLIYYTKEKSSKTPYLSFIWHDQGRNTDTGMVVKISMQTPMKAFRRQVKLDKPTKFRTIIELALDTLAQQNQEYNTIHNMLTDELEKINNVKVLNMTRFGSTWQINIGDNDGYERLDPVKTIIQYNEKTKEFLYQIRHASKDLTFTLLKTTTEQNIAI